MTRIKIPSQGLEALRTLSSVNTQRFNALAATVAELKEPSIRPSVLYGVVFAETRNEHVAKAFSSLFISLALYVRAERVNTTRVVEDLRAALSDLVTDKNSQASEYELVQWFSEVQSAIDIILKSASVVLSAKALDLSVDFDCLYTSANVVTDIRPVFDDTRLKICGAIVAQTLRLHYVPDGPSSGEKEISLALDYDDIVKLIEELENAKQKAETVKAHFSEQSKLEIFSIGEETYGFE